MGTKNILEYDTGANLNDTAITDWIIYRSDSGAARNAWYSEHGMKPALSDANNRPYISTPTQKPALSLKGATAETSFSTLVDGETYNLTFYAAHYHYNASNTSSAGAKLIVKVKQVGYADQTLYDDYPTRIASDISTAQYFDYISLPFTASGTGTATTVSFSFSEAGNSNRNMFISDVQVISSAPPQASDGHGIFDVTDGDKLNLMRIKEGNSISIPTPVHGVMAVGLSPTPTADTPSSGDNSTRLATTAFVTAAVAAGGSGLSTTTITDQSVASHIVTSKTTFDADGQLVSKKYVDDSDVPNVQPHLSTIAVGNQAMGNNNSPEHTTALGYRAHYDITNNSPGKNVCIGSLAGISFQMSSSVMVGYNSGGGGTRDGDNNTFLGNETGWSCAGSGNIFIGSKVMYNGQGGSSQGDNRFVLGRDTNHLFEGKIPTSSSSGELRINAGQLELDKNNIPTSYNTTIPNQIYVKNGQLRIGVDKDFYIRVSGNTGSTTYGRAFTTYIFPTIDDDQLDENNNSYYDTTTGEITLPHGGIYFVSGTMRSADANQTDASPAKTQWGVGIHTSNNDGSHFLWHTVHDTNNIYDRSTYTYSKIIRYNADDKLRTIIYLDNGTPKLMSGGEMCVLRVGD